MMITGICLLAAVRPIRIILLCPSYCTRRRKIYMTKKKSKHYRVVRILNANVYIYDDDCASYLVLGSVRSTVTVLAFCICAQVSAASFVLCVIRAASAQAQLACAQSGRADLRRRSSVDLCVA
jgi:hypothetical protein